MTGSLLPLALVVAGLVGASALLAAAYARELRQGLARRRAPVEASGRAAELLADGLLPLADCPRGHRACLRCIEVDHCVVHRLMELGLTPGVELRVVHDAGGSMLVSVRGSRVALGRDLAQQLWVAPRTLDEDMI